MSEKHLDKRSLSATKTAKSFLENRLWGLPYKPNCLQKSVIRFLASNSGCTIDGLIFYLDKCDPTFSKWVPFLSEYNKKPLYDLAKVKDFRASEAAAIIANELGIKWPKGVNTKMKKPKSSKKYDKQKETNL